MGVVNHRCGNTGAADSIRFGNRAERRADRIHDRNKRRRLEKDKRLTPFQWFCYLLASRG